MYDPKTKSWEWRQGYDYATEQANAEIERLRAENEQLRDELALAQKEIDSLRAALKETVDYMSTISARDYCPKANAILS